MDSIAVIILNYITWQETLKEAAAVRAVLGERPAEIIVVDNASPNDSADQLRKAADGNFTFLESGRNGGYAAGNNVGLRYAAQKGHTYCWILNNDVEFSDPAVLEKMLEVFRQDPQIAAVSPDIYSPEGYLFNRDAKPWTVWDLSLGMLSYRNRGRAEEEAKKGWLYVYRPQGCCMLLRTADLAAVDFLDEATFLYCEEPILAERLLAKGCRCACCSATGVIHNHGTTVKKALQKRGFIQNNMKSFRHYLKAYRKFSVFTRLWCELFYKLKLLLLD